MICAICYSKFNLKTTLNCSHSYCVNCIKKWSETNNTCPLCRMTFAKNEIIENINGVKTRGFTRNNRRIELNKELDILSKKINDSFNTRIDTNALYIPDICEKDIHLFFRKLLNNRDVFKSCNVESCIIAKSCKNLPWMCETCKYKKKIKKMLSSLNVVYNWKPVNEWIFKFNEVNFF